MSEMSIPVATVIAEMVEDPICESIKTAKFYNIEPDLDWDEDDIYTDDLNIQIETYIKEHPDVLHGDILYVKKEEYAPQFGYVVVYRQKTIYGFRYTEAIYCAIGKGTTTLINSLSDEMTGIDYTTCVAGIELFLKEELGTIL